MQMAIHEIEIDNNGQLTILRQDWSGEGIYNARISATIDPPVIFFWRPAPNEGYTPHAFYCPQPLIFQEPIILDRVLGEETR